MRPYRWIFIVFSSFAAFPLITQGNEDVSCSDPAQLDFQPLFQLLAQCEAAIEQKNDLLLFTTYRLFHTALYQASAILNPLIKTSDLTREFTDNLAQCMLYAVYYEKLLKKKNIDLRSLSQQAEKNLASNAKGNNEYFVALFEVLKAYVEVIQSRLLSSKDANQSNTDNIIDDMIQYLKNQNVDKQTIQLILEKFNIIENYQKVFQTHKNLCDIQSFHSNLNRAAPSMTSKPILSSNAEPPQRENKRVSALETDPFVIPDSPILNYKKNGVVEANCAPNADSSSPSNFATTGSEEPAESIPLSNDNIIMDNKPDFQTSPHTASSAYPSEKSSYTSEIAANYPEKTTSSNLQESLDYVNEASFIDDCYAFFLNQETQSIEKYQNLPIDSILIKLRTIRSKDPTLTQKREEICEKLEQLLIQINIKGEKSGPLHLRDIIAFNTESIYSHPN